MKKYKGINNLTEGPILRSLVKIAVPIILANFLHTAYQLTDTFWVGRLGSDAIAAVSISFPVIFVLVSLGGGFSLAGTILVAQYRGKGDRFTVDYLTAQTFFAVIILSALIGTIGYFLSPEILKLFNASENVFNNAVLYMKISFSGIVFMFTFMVFQSLLRGAGDVKTPMFIISGTVLLNLFIDPMFIFGWGCFPKMGVAGAAIATIIAQCISAATGIFLLLRGKHEISLNLKGFKPDFPLIKKMFKLGIPASIEQTTIGFGMNLMTFLVARFGTVALAAYGIGHRVMSFVVIPIIGLSMASSTLVGQNIGAGKIQRAEEIVKKTSSISFFILTFLGAIIFIFAAKITAFFIPGETETINKATYFIKLMAFTFGFMGIHQIVSGAFIGSGNTLMSMLLSAFSLWFIRFPVAYILSHCTGLAETGIWLAFPITNILTAAIAIFWYSKGTWKKRRITEEIKLSVETTEEAIVEEGRNS